MALFEKNKKNLFLLREGFIRKKKIIVNFHNWRGGGGRTNFFCFHNFFFIFFNVLIHANMQRKKFSVWGGGNPLTWKPKNFGYVREKPWNFSKFYGFIRGKKVLFTKMCFSLCVKKKYISHFLGGGESGPKVWKFTLFFLFRMRPSHMKMRNEIWKFC